MAHHPSNASTPDTADESPGTAQPRGYAERLVVSWWLWLIALVAAAALAAEVYLGAPGQPLWLPYVVLLPLTAALLAYASRLRVAVIGDELRVDDARLPVRYIARVGILDAAAKRDALGPYGDPLAFIVQRPWVREAVLVVLSDPDDPTPYWVISARRPRRLVAALRAAGPHIVTAEQPR